MVARSIRSVEKLDPADAWKAWKPEGKGWSLKWVGHLYRRAGFGAPAYDAKKGSWETLREALAAGPEACIDKLLQGNAGIDDFNSFMDDLSPVLGRSRIFEPDQNRGQRELQGWWLYRMVYTPHPLLERMTLLWHNHFATSIAKVRDSQAMLRQNRTLRRHALGKFQPFLLDISRDPAMLIWLDSNSNIKSHPNENYAREVMELFSLGVGNYTETDIRQAARAFTGWHTDGEEFTFVAAQHDNGKKTVLEQTGNWDGTDIVRILLERPVCARFLVRKLYKQFISEAEVPPDSLIEPLADELRKSGYDIGKAVRTMLSSRLFFSEHAYRQRIKSPVDFVVGLVRTLSIQPNMQTLAQAMDGLGQNLFAPPNVKGWDGGKAWLNTATLLARQNLALSLLQGRTSEDGADRLRGAVEKEPEPEPPVRARNSLGELLAKYGGKTPEDHVRFLFDLLLHGDTPQESRDKVLGYLRGAKPEDKPAYEQRLEETAHTICLMPEFQLA
jgi:hypothetical protein